MIITALVVMSLMWWGHRLLFRRMRSPGVETTVATPARHASAKARPLGLEDDPDQWHASRTAWSALDEHQLTRLLTESAPTKGAATIPTESSVRRVERGDVP